MMEEEVVRRRGWLSRDEFLDYIAASNLIPGPNSTELAIHIGHARAGWRGLLVAGACFILPAALIVTAIAWFYVEYGQLPAATGILYGVKPVVIAVVAQALWLLGKSALKSRTLTVIGVVATIAAVLRMNELLVLLLAGALAVPGNRGRAASVAIPAMSTTATLFTTFLKIGSVLYGGGYVLLAFLRADFVDRLHWLTERQLIDAVAVGQVTPGPVFTTATFIGYVIAGGKGAALATIGIFLPAFIFVAASRRIVPGLRRSPSARAFLDGVTVASLALMAVVTVDLGRAAFVDATTVIVSLASFVLLVHARVNSAWLVLAGAAVGVLTQ